MKKYAFTMAEILISLTIIGIIAAITLPALQGNINEKTWNTQRKALHSRLSQAIALMPALNGFGTTGTVAQIQAKTAEVFLTEGLSKVLKINNICDKDHLQDCGIPDKITVLGGENTINTPTRLTDLNPSMMSTLYDPTGTEVLKYLTNSYAAAFETANGESVLTFYNPYCTSKDVRVPLIIEGSSRPGFSNKIHVCANFIYDLNGKKGPNTIGKDMGFITTLYSYDPSVVMAIPMVLLDARCTQIEAIQACKAIDQEYTIPNRDEAASIYYNNNLHSKRRQTWTSESVDNTYALYNSYVSGGLYNYPKSEKNYVTCIKR